MKDQEKSVDTNQREPVEHCDGRIGVILSYESKDEVLVKWDDGEVSRVGWDSLIGYD